MMKRRSVLKLATAVFILAAGVHLGPHQALAATCADLKKSIVAITANGYGGKMHFHSGTSLPAISGTITFTGEPQDSFTGTCTGRHIVFTRVRPNVFTQEYDGWISTTQNIKQFAGVFSHGPSNQRWPWCGSWTEVPK